MIGEFQCVGLCLDGTFTCQDEKDIFWAKSELTPERFKALFRWAKADKKFWKDGLVVSIRHEGLNEDTSPKNPVVVDVRHGELIAQPL